MAARNNRSIAFEGQRNAAELQALMDARRKTTLAARASYLKAHPDYIACAVERCMGLVGPAFQRQADDGSKWGLCPRRDAHVRLMPEVFGPKPAA